MTQTINPQTPEINDIDYWKNLHPATKLIVKIFQHIRSKLYDLAEVRARLDDDMILITTYKSEIRISKVNNEITISFKRWDGDTTHLKMRVQRAKIELEEKELEELLDIIKKQILDMLEYDTEPDYRFIVETSEKIFNSSD